ncbi:hypothetical protein SAMN05661044_00288 [Olivibacter domesticus]|uniref:Uncharacterized protein n=1 Tax=Olivibacter domesticus TaxID=407022 RepID=A0A1H7H5W1_OLID1|nr:hypothetical protein SAMN05661044_00288 [Olivibacter domesticus]
MQILYNMKGKSYNKIDLTGAIFGFHFITCFNPQQEIRKDSSHCELFWGRFCHAINFVYLFKKRD